MQLCDELGIAARELDAQRVAEQLVQAVCLTAPVERDQQVQRRGRIGKLVVAVVALEHGIADGRAQFLEHRGVEQEVARAARQDPEQLLAHVVDDDAVVARELCRGLDRIGGVPEDERREVQPDRPTLGAGPESVDRGRRERDPRPRQQFARFAPVHGETLRRQLVHPPVGAHPAERELGFLTRHHDELRPGRHAVGERLHERPDLAPPQPVRVVEHEHERPSTLGHRALEPGHEHSREVEIDRPQLLFGAGFQGFELVERAHDVTKQDRGIVVLGGEREPARPTADRRPPTAPRACSCPHPPHP